MEKPVNSPHLRKLGVEAAREVTHRTLDPNAVDVIEGRDASDEPAYFYTFRIVSDVPEMEQVAETIRLQQMIRDHLLDHGDDHYPYVAITYSAQAIVSDTPP